MDTMYIYSYMSSLSIFESVTGVEVDLASGMVTGTGTDVATEAADLTLRGDLRAAAHDRRAAHHTR